MIGASAGGVEALLGVCRRLPATLRAAVFVVLHVPAGAGSVLPQILARGGPLPARHAAHGDPLEEGTLAVAPPDVHLLVRPDHVELWRGPRENGHRPAVDPLLRSAAEAFGNRVIGVILSGSRDDGAVGLRTVKDRGGITIVQADPLYTGMPDSARAATAVDLVLPLQEIGPALVDLIASEPGGAPEPGPAQVDARDDEDDATGLTCPDCGGALWAEPAGDVVQLRCSIGHRYSPASIDQRHAETVERALWTAVRLLEERADLSERLGRRMELAGSERGRRRFTQRAEAALRHAREIRSMLESEARPALGEEGPEPQEATG